MFYILCTFSIFRYISSKYFYLFIISLSIYIFLCIYFFATFSFATHLATTIISFLFTCSFFHIVSLRPFDSFDLNSDLRCFFLYRSSTYLFISIPRTVIITLYYILLSIALSLGLA